jgi:hypothetical protein
LEGIAPEKVSNGDGLEDQYSLERNVERAGNCGGLRPDRNHATRSFGGESARQCVSINSREDLEIEQAYLAVCRNGCHRSFSGDELRQDPRRGEAGRVLKRACSIIVTSSNLLANAGEIEGDYLSAYEKSGRPAVAISIQHL